jgi:hypothetical protein
MYLVRRTQGVDERNVLVDIRVGRSYVVMDELDTFARLNVAYVGRRNFEAGVCERARCVVASTDAYFNETCTFCVVLAHIFDEKTFSFPSFHAGFIIRHG